MLDYRILNNPASLQDFQRMQEEFELKKQALQQQATGQDPAALKLANEYEAAMGAGDIDRANRIAAFAKIYDKNVTMTPDGQYVPLQGLPQALGQLEFGKESGTQQAKDIYEPGRAGAVESAKLGQELQYGPSIKAAETAATVHAEDISKAQTGLGKASEQSKQMLDLLAQIEQSPGLEAVVGLPNPMQGGLGLFNVRGTPAADFQAKLDQLGGKQFLEAFESLKGGGQITQIEGEKATNAIARMQTSQSEKAFREALNEFKGIVQRAAERAQAKASQQVLPPVFDGLDPIEESRRAILQQQQQTGVTNPMQRPDLQGKVINWEDLP